MGDQYSGNRVGNYHIGLRDVIMESRMLLWWHKPQDIGVPVYLEAKTPLSTNSCNMNIINGSQPLERSDSEAESNIEPPQLIKETASSNQVIEWEHVVPEKLADARLS